MVLFYDDKAIVVGGVFKADRKAVGKELPVDFEALFSVADTVKTIAYPLRTFDRSGLKIALIARGDFLTPIIGAAKEENGCRRHGADFPSHFFKAVLEICAVTPH